MCAMNSGNDRNRITLAHGGGGQLTDELISGSILPRIGNADLNRLLDSGLVELPKGCEGGQLALTIDGYVVQPWCFPGGNIGTLAVCGTVNDLAVCGVKPLGLALSLIIAEGFAKADLEAVLDGVETAGRKAGVNIITGDTKVVGYGQADGIYITTAGVGIVESGCELGVERIETGDVIMINGSIADHGLAVMLAREMPEMTSRLKSDAAPLNHLIRRVMDCVGNDLVFMRDATRGGLAGVASDLANRSGLHIRLDENSIYVSSEVRHAAEMLGLDPLEVANEGKVVTVVRSSAAEKALECMRDDPLGKNARIIGQVTDVRDGLCELYTGIGGRRILQKPYGEQLPRIC